MFILITRFKFLSKLYDNESKPDRHSQSRQDWPQLDFFDHRLTLAIECVIVCLNIIKVE
jgi:hypothetical protein